MRLKTVFWGNSEFVLPSLEVLRRETSLKAIFTGPDQSVGRNLKEIKIPEPKLFAQRYGIPVFQNEDLKSADLPAEIRNFDPDLMVVISYGKILPEKIFSLPPLGTVNLHASLLPHYRGASPIQQALLNGDLKTGVTIQKINAQLDAGNILLQRELEIDPRDTYLTLRPKLAEESGQLLEEYLRILSKAETLPEYPQNERVTYCSKISKQDGEIRWNLDARQIINKWRAFIQWPGIFCSFRGGALKLKQIEWIDEDGSQPGEIIKADKSGLWIRCGRGAISLLEVQPPNKKVMTYQDFLNGYRLKAGELFI